MLKSADKGGGTIYEGSKPGGAYKVIKITVPPMGEPVLISNLQPEVFTPEASRKVLDLASFFSWGFPGPGSRQLAIALIYDATGSELDALVYYPELFSRFVNTWGQEWSINSCHIRNFLELKKRHTLMNLGGLEA